MRVRAYDAVSPGQWVRPIRSGYKMACCDCGLVHLLDFRLVSDWPYSSQKNVIQFRAFRDNRATAAKRRENKKRDRASR